MIKRSYSRTSLRRVSAICLCVLALLFALKCTAEISQQGGVQIYGLDKDVGSIKLGDEFDRSFVIWNLTAQPIRINVIHACSCAGSNYAQVNIRPLMIIVMHMHYHINSRDKGVVTTKAIIRCTFSDGLSKDYMVASTYTMRD